MYIYSHDTCVFIYVPDSYIYICTSKCRKGENLCHVPFRAKTGDPWRDEKNLAGNPHFKGQSGIFCVYKIAFTCFSVHTCTQANVMGVFM